jgi:hypothetical protein
MLESSTFFSFSLVFVLFFNVSILLIFWFIESQLNPLAFCGTPAEDKSVLNFNKLILSSVGSGEEGY